MQSPLALVLDEDPAVRERARATLSREGIETIAVATPQEALEALRAHPELVGLRQEDGLGVRRIQGRSEASAALRRRVQDLAAGRDPVLFAGETGSGRRYGARCLHALAKQPD